MEQEKLNYKKIAIMILETYSENQVITKKELEGLLDYEHIDIKDYKNNYDYQEAAKQKQFEWLRKVEALRNEFLETHGLRLITAIGDGYYIPDAKKQIEYSIEDSKRKVYKAAKRNELYISSALRRTTDLDLKRRANNKIASLSMIQGLAK